VFASESRPALHRVVLPDPRRAVEHDGGRFFAGAGDELLEDPKLVIAANHLPPEPCPWRRGHGTPAVGSLTGMKQLTDGVWQLSGFPPNGSTSTWSGTS